MNLEKIYNITNEHEHFSTVQKSLLNGGIFPLQENEITETNNRTNTTIKLIEQVNIIKSDEKAKGNIIIVADGSALTSKIVCFIEKNSTHTSSNKQLTINDIINYFGKYKKASNDNNPIGILYYFTSNTPELNNWDKNLKGPDNESWGYIVTAEISKYLLEYYKDSTSLEKLKLQIQKVAIQPKGNVLKRGTNEAVDLLLGSPINTNIQNKGQPIHS